MGDNNWNISFSDDSNNKDDDEDGYFLSDNKNDEKDERKGLEDVDTQEVDQYIKEARKIVSNELSSQFWGLDKSDRNLKRNIEDCKEALLDAMTENGKEQLNKLEMAASSFARANKYIDRPQDDRQIEDNLEQVEDNLRKAAASLKGYATETDASPRAVSKADNVIDRMNLDFEELDERSNIGRF